MEDLITYAVGFLALGIVLKVCKVVKEVIVTLIYALGLIIAIKFTLQYVLKPVFKALAWIGKKAWEGFRMLCRYIDRHYQYRKTNDMIPDYGRSDINMNINNDRRYEERHYTVL